MISMTRLTCYSLFLGARNTPAAGERFSRADDACVREVTFRHFPEGFTVLNAAGGWYDPKRGFIKGESRELLVCALSLDSVRRWCDELARKLQQKELLVVELGPALTFRARARRLLPKGGRSAKRARAAD
jgi:hypothetical protein